uniref:Uncharacterized protein n=1 Tax=Populus trichocarpa TaxID=3694 RepID=A0A3N7FDS8_POPTR
MPPRKQPPNSGLNRPLTSPRSKAKRGSALYN